jgi:regulator of protease activity HflC (stomatin/prohibitin superfamily)
VATGIGVVVAITVIFVLSGLKILNEYERSVVFRLGRLIPC